MADATATPAKTAPKKKTTKPKVPAAHPKYSEMVSAAIVALKERSGSSRAAIVKYICANYKVGDNVKKVNSSVKTALKGGVGKGSLKQVKGTGASGSFRIGEKAKAVKPKAKKAAKKPAAKKPAAKKVAKPKKVAAKKPKAKTPKKPAAKKATKPAAKKVKTPKKPKAKSPKKIKAAKPKAKKPAAKK